MRGVLTRGGRVSDSYGTRETEVAIENFVNRLVELYPGLDPIRLSELVSGLVEEEVAATKRGEG
jgi:hypothetical protein